MPKYHVQFLTDGEWAEAQISATSLEHALARARECDVSGLVFEPIRTPRIVHEILVTDDQGGQWMWRSDDLLLRLAAEDLLIAAKNVLTALKVSYGLSWTPVARDTLRHLKEAIDLARGRKS